MKTFDEKDLITWSNRDKAVIGNEYYFGDIVEDLNDNIKRNNTYILTDILNGSISHPFVNKGIAYACILPVDAVKEEKKYRACKTLKEMYELLNNGEFDMDENECIYQLIDFTVHTKNKQTGKEYYSIIASIAKDIDDTYKILIHGACYSLLSLFKNFEIELNGKWQPFGVLED